MDSPTYDPTTHLNKIFSSPDTLNELPQLLNHVSQYKRQLTEEINKSTAKYERVDLSEDISHLATSIGEIKRDSSMTKQSISQMTGSIQRLDCTKKNLVASMTLLKRLQMLVNVNNTTIRRYISCWVF